MAGPYEILGMEKLVAALKRAGAEADKALVQAMVDEMDEIIADAKRRTPVDTGTLRASGVTLPPKKVGHQIVVEGGFGGAASDYAIVQHEDTTLHHTVGEAKFLEKSALERVGKLERNLAVRIAAALARVGR